MRRKYFLVVISLCSVLLVGGVAGLLTSSAQTPSAQLYVSPASKSVVQGQQFQVLVRLNTPEAVNTVQADLTYDEAALDFVSISSSGSAFSIEAEASGGSGSVRIGRGSISNVTGDVLVATITFKAEKSSGTTAVNFAGSSAVVRTSDSQNILGTKTGGSYSLTAPPSTTTTAPAAPATTTTTPSNTSPTSKPKNSAANPEPGTTSSSEVAETPIISVIDKLEFTRAGVSVISPKPVKAYIEYEANGVKATTPETAFATTHNLQLDPNLLIPGTTYTYKLVTIDEAGASTEGEPTTFKTKGFTLQLTVRDKAGDLVRNTDVTLYSEPLAGKTDDNGRVSFSDVAPGAHELEVKDGSKPYKQPITVYNEIKEVEGVQSADPQAFEIVFASYTAPRRMPLTLLTSIGVMVLLVGAGIFILVRKRRLALVAATPQPATTAVPSQTQVDISAGQVIKPETSHDKDETPS